MSIDTTWLSTWFLYNYIRKCSELCPDHISQLFDNISGSIKLQNAVSAVIVWRQNKNTLLDTWAMFGFLYFQMSGFAHRVHLTARLCAYWMNELAKIDSCLPVYFTAVAFLHVAYKSLKHGLNHESMDILATLFGQFISRRHCPNHSASLLSLSQAAKLMKFLANKSLSTMSLIAIELSKAYLYRALRCKDSDSDSIYCLANVYLAVLYYSTGQYETAIDHCALVTSSQDHSRCMLSNVVQRELLPKNDDDIDSMLGLAVFYQHLQTAALNQQYQTELVSVFTTELFAYYLHIKCLSLAVCPQFEHTSLTDEFNRYKIHISDTEQLFIGDVLLFLSLNRTLRHKFYHILVGQQSPQPKNNPTSELVELLQKSAVEHLTAARQLEARYIGSVDTIVTTDFEALYSYKRGDYQRCLQLSTQNVHTLLNAAKKPHVLIFSGFVHMSYEVPMPDIPTFPEFIQLLDDDIASLTALMLIVNPKCRDAGCCVCISQLTLSLYLMIQCQLKLRHSVMSLAQTVEFIKDADVELTLDKLLLKLTARKALLYITAMNK